MSSITLEDVLDFISTATADQMDAIENAMNDENHTFYCSECDEREHKGCDCESPDYIEAEAKKEVLEQIVRAGNQFGLEDMFVELRREAESVGVYLNQGIKL